MKRAKIVKAWAELGDERPRLGDFEDYMNRPMGCGPYGIVRAWDVFECLTRGECWWMYLDVRRRDCSLRVAKLKSAERRPRYYAAENERRRALAAERRRIRTRTTRMKGQSSLIQVRQAKLGRTNSGRSYIVKKSTYD